MAHVHTICEYEADNRDHRTTELHFIINLDNVGPIKCKLSIDPADLLLNAIQNLPAPLDERYEIMWTAMVKMIQSDLDRINEEG